ncbi:hypothetical protein D3C87_2088950 [compost metagenome]
MIWACSSFCFSSLTFTSPSDVATSLRSFCKACSCFCNWAIWLAEARVLLAGTDEVEEELELTCMAAIVPPINA